MCAHMYVLWVCDIIWVECSQWKTGCQTFLQYSTQDLSSACEHNPVPPVSGKIQALFRVGGLNEALKGPGGVSLQAITQMSNERLWFWAIRAVNRAGDLKKRKRLKHCEKNETKKSALGLSSHSRLTYLDRWNDHKHNRRLMCSHNKAHLSSRHSFSSTIAFQAGLLKGRGALLARKSHFTAAIRNVLTFLQL